MSTPRILIITGYGLNCEAESQLAWQRAGATADLIHLNDLLAQPQQLASYQGLMFIGGFSFGDHMGSGLVLARRIKHQLREPLSRFIADGHLIMGVCNGFQVLTRMGLLPGLEQEYWTPKAALMMNDCGHFIDKWITVCFEENSPCVFTQGLHLMDLPIRHGEGRFFVPDAKLLQKMEEQNCVVCRYANPTSGEPATNAPDNPNGSLNAIAGICDPSGRIFGLMPHPEAFLHPQNHPKWDRQKEQASVGAGQQLFVNAVNFLK